MTNKDEIPEDAPLLSCWVKKSTSVAKKAGIAIAAIVGTILAGILLDFGLVAAYPTIVLIGTAITAFFVSIPWWVYVGIVVVAAILVYSLVWCIARKLTDEDWNSDTAKGIAFALALALAAVALTVFALTVSALALAFALAFALALAAVALTVFAFALAADTKPILFIGAYIHYRRRMKKVGDQG